MTHSQAFIMWVRTIVVFSGSLFPLIAYGSAKPASLTVSLITDSPPGPATQHGVSRISAALQHKGIATERVSSLSIARGNPVIVLITKETQQRNLQALNRIVKMTHDRGLNFTLGIWDHVYRGGVQGPKDQAQKPTEGIVWGLTAEVNDPSGVKWVRLLCRSVTQFEDCKILDTRATVRSTFR
jgi:hypothetical protein